MKKGLNQWCLPQSVGLRRILYVCKEAGIDGVELNMVDPEADSARPVADRWGVLTLDASDEEIREASSLAREVGIDLPSVSTGLHWKYPLSSPDQALREKGIQVVERMLHVAKLLGADTILLVPGAVNDQIPYDEAYRRSLDALKALAPQAERLGVFIGIENVWNKFLLSPLEMRDFIDAVGSEYIGAYFDVGNVLAYGYPDQWIRILGHRIRKVHVKDFRTDIGNIYGFTNLLLGDVPWERVMAALRDIGYDGYMTAELGTYKFGVERLPADVSGAMDVIFAL